MRRLRLDVPDLNACAGMVLALGAQGKAGFCFLHGDTVDIYCDIGGLSDIKAYGEFVRSVRRFIRRRHKTPAIIACDMHPGYLSTGFAHELKETIRGAAIKPIQHHKAHIASLIAEKKIRGRVIGVAFDGTGLGEDGNIWGGEFFAGDAAALRRVAHLAYTPMPGGEQAIRETWRMAMGYLYRIYGRTIRREALQFIKRFRCEDIDLLMQVVEKKINTPLTSSMGRLFDCVSSMSGICDRVLFEGQAAIELEKNLPRDAAYSPRDTYKFAYARAGDTLRIEPSRLIRSILLDLRRNVSRAVISFKFHNAVCDMIKEVCVYLRKKYDISQVCLSGGVFQNRYLTANTAGLLKKNGFSVYIHEVLPAHDGNISLGQAVIAAVEGK